MKELKIKRQNRKNKGITLIALVVTIVVLLILAAVSISMLDGENGIITRAIETKEETRAATVEEKKELWKEEKQTDKYLEENTTKTLEELLNELEEEKLLTEEERNEVEEKGHVVIGSKDILFSEGLTESVYKITNSLEEVKFNKIIVEGDIIAEKKGYTSYTIEGISNEKEGEYITTGSVTGKNGNLEVVGDINDTTFKYTLTGFMQGDEIFYCKVNIDGEQYYKEIKVLQGEEVTYEEDFVGIKYTGDWQDDVNENYTNGKCKKLNGKGNIKFSFYGTGLDLVSVVTPDNPVSWVLVYQENEGVIANTEFVSVITWDNPEIKYRVSMNDIFERKGQINKALTLKNSIHTGEMTSATENNVICIDSIIIYK